MEQDDKPANVRAGASQATAEGATAAQDKVMLAMAELHRVPMILQTCKRLLLRCHYGAMRCLGRMAKACTSGNRIWLATGSCSIRQRADSTEKNMDEDR